MDPRLLLGEPLGQSWVQLAELALAFVLSASIGLEREIRQKSAGLRTYTLVGFSSALVMLVSKYGFTNILESGRVVLDPSRIAAQIVSGIGFIGGGLIFVRKDIVRGLTTAATVWLTAAVGMACGAGLPILAIAVTFGHFIVIALFPAHRAPAAKIALGAVNAADFLSGRPRCPSRGACMLHRERVRGQSRAGRAGSGPRGRLRAQARPGRFSSGGGRWRRLDPAAQGHRHAACGGSRREVGRPPGRASERDPRRDFRSSRRRQSHHRLSAVSR